MSHPAWVCGLKPLGTIYVPLVKESHPAWVCGLKQKDKEILDVLKQSHPAWVCGLKPTYLLSQRDGICHTLRGCVD